MYRALREFRQVEKETPGRRAAAEADSEVEALGRLASFFPPAPAPAIGPDPGPRPVGPARPTVGTTAPASPARPLGAGRDAGPARRRN